MTDIRVEAANPHDTWHRTLPCAICDHLGDAHSSIVLDGFCLECGCDGYMRRKLPDPFMWSGWQCPICKDRAEGYGTTRHRFGHWPFKRRIHIDCMEPR